MKDWSDLEERYQDIRARDPIKADEFKRWMTTKFQETVAALEASGTAEKHQLSALHQQRVQVFFLLTYFCCLFPEGFLSQKRVIRSRTLTCATLIIKQ